MQSVLRLGKHMVIAVPTSEVAASLLEYGQTAHSAFKSLIPCHANSACNISPESKIAHQIRRASFIIWDEIGMCVLYCIKAVDWTLRVITEPQIFYSKGYAFFSVEIFGKYFL